MSKDPSPCLLGAEITTSLGFPGFSSWSPWAVSDPRRKSSSGPGLHTNRKTRLHSQNSCSSNPPIPLDPGEPRRLLCHPFPSRCNRRCPVRWLWGVPRGHICKGSHTWKHRASTHRRKHTHTHTHNSSSSSSWYQHRTAEADKAISAHALYKSAQVSWPNPSYATVRRIVNIRRPCLVMQLCISAAVCNCSVSKLIESKGKGKVRPKTGHEGSEGK